MLPKDDTNESFEKVIKSCQISFIIITQSLSRSGGRENIKIELLPYRFPPGTLAWDV